MAKKKIQGQINFYRAMAVLGILVAGFIGYAFYGSAPALSAIPQHKKSVEIPECLNCHVQNPKNAPIMPHREMGSCFFCHTPPAGI